MPPIQTLFMNSIVGLDSGPTPPQALSYMMGTVADPQVFNFDQNFQGDTIIIGSQKMNSRKAPPQAPPRSMMGVFAVSAGISVAWIMGGVDDPQSSAAWTLRNDKLANEVCNYPPQIGGARGS